jgi:hypothetical protein
MKRLLGCGIAILLSAACVSTPEPWKPDVGDLKSLDSVADVKSPDGTVDMTVSEVAPDLPLDAPDTDTCQPQCEGPCGDDGCGGQCDGCPEGMTCNQDGLCCDAQGACQGVMDCDSDADCVEPQTCGPDGLCQTGCTPNCDGMVCGDDGCGGHCGVCLFGSCNDGVCVCTPDCAGKECGNDGCGGICNSCDTSAGESCWSGDCLAACGPDTVSFSDTVQKFTEMKMGQDGMDGQALDVDGNSNTCSPKGQCENGNDNAMAEFFASAGLASDFDAELDSALNEGTIVMVVELDGYNPAGSTFSLNMYRADPLHEMQVCNFQDDHCDYLVENGAIDWTNCAPLVTFDNAKVADGILTAGGVGYKFDLILPFLGGEPIVLTLKDARIRAVHGPSYPLMALVDGVIGGVMETQSLLDAVDELPEDALPGGMSKESVKMILNMFIKNDIDTNGDGTLDSASIGVKFQTFSASIVGVK